VFKVLLKKFLQSNSLENISENKKNLFTEQEILNIAITFKSVQCVIISRPIWSQCGCPSCPLQVSLSIIIILTGSRVFKVTVPS